MKVYNTMKVYNMLFDGIFSPTPAKKKNLLPRSITQDVSWEMSKRLEETTKQKLLQKSGKRDR